MIFFIIVAKKAYHSRISEPAPRGPAHDESFLDRVSGARGATCGGAGQRFLVFSSDDRDDPPDWSKDAAW